MVYALLYYHLLAALYVESVGQCLEGGGAGAAAVDGVDAGLFASLLGRDVADASGFTFEGEGIVVSVGRSVAEGEIGTEGVDGAAAFEYLQVRQSVI